MSYLSLIPNNIAAALMMLTGFSCLPLTVFFMRFLELRFSNGTEDRRLTLAIFATLLGIGIALGLTMFVDYLSYPPTLPVRS